MLVNVEEVTKYLYIKILKKKVALEINVGLKLIYLAELELLRRFTQLLIWKEYCFLWGWNWAVGTWKLEEDMGYKMIILAIEPNW
jgi:hypothetical protein